jgi:hypothetical protein
MTRIAQNMNQLARILAEKLSTKVVAGLTSSEQSEAKEAADSNQSDKNRQGIYAGGQQGKAIQTLLAELLQHQLLNQKPKTSTEQTATSSKALSQSQAGSPSARREIERLMRSYNPESSDADEVAVKISERKDLLANLTVEERKKLVMGLFDGSTGEDEEDAAMDIIRSASDADLKEIVDSIGWDRLRDELDPHDIDEMSKRLANPKATSSTSPASSALTKVGIENPNEEIGEIKSKIKQKLDSMSSSEVESISSEILSGKKEILAEIANLERTGKGTQAAALRAMVDQLKERANGDLKTKLDQFSHQIRYTGEINGRIKSGDYSGLLENMRDMADPTKSKEERIAIYETLLTIEPELRAMEETIQLYGNSKQKADAEVFMSRYRTFTSTFNENDSAGDFLEKLAAKLNLTGQTVEDKFEALRSQTAHTVSDVSNSLKLDHFLDTLSDDQARELANNLYSKDTKGVNHLASLPTDFKVRLINNMISGFTGDEEEQAILHILSTTKEKNPQEFYQIISAIGYDALDSNIHGEEYNEFVRLMRN